MEKVKVTVDFTDKNFSAGSGKIGGIVLVTHKTFEGVKKTFKETLKFHIDSCIADGDELPIWAVKGNYEIEWKLTTAALLQKLDKTLNRSTLARVTGINERQLGHYATGRTKPRTAQRTKIINGIHQIGKEFISVV